MSVEENYKDLRQFLQKEEYDRSSDGLDFQIERPLVRRLTFYGKPEKWRFISIVISSFQGEDGRSNVVEGIG